jgi:hypothetical protein
MMPDEEKPANDSDQGEPVEGVELPERTYDRVLYFSEQILQEEGKTSDRKAAFTSGANSNIS